MTFEVEVPRRPAASLAPVIGSERYSCLTKAAEWGRDQLGNRIIWNVNSTSAGGGVAEMLWTQTGYAKDLGFPVRWMVIGGDPGFFAMTKRLHNQLHGQAAREVSPAEARHYSQVLAANAEDLLGQMKAGDVALLHDPQTAGLAGPLTRAGVHVVWRSHVGVEWQNDATRRAWEFLRPHLQASEGFVFTRLRYAPSWVPAAKTWIVPPSIDPLSAKNQDLDLGAVRAILATVGVLDHQPGRPGRFIRKDGTVGEVTRPGSVVANRRPRAEEPVVIQVSRWDRLKDMGGVMRGFAGGVALGGDGYLVLAGPAVSGVADDPEGAAVYGECLAQWQALPAHARDRVMLLTLPLDDLDENAAMVNALQRHAKVIAQKSLAEGFGLTVAEGMWKARPVVGSAVGGIAEQIPKGAGVLLPAPDDLHAFGKQVRRLLDSPEQAERIGLAAQAHVRQHYVGDIDMLRHVELLAAVLGAPAGPGTAQLHARHITRKEGNRHGRQRRAHRIRQAPIRR